MGGHTVWGTIVEDRGLLGVNGRRLYHIDIPMDPECLQVLQTFHSSSTLGLISNCEHPPYVHQVLDDHGVRQWCAVIVISGAGGVQTPPPQLCRVALAQTGLPPADVVDVGDTGDDVQGARAAGMPPTGHTELWQGRNHTHH